MFSLTSIQKLVEHLYIVNVLDTFGEEGRDALERLWDGLRQVYAHSPPELFANSLFVCSPITAAPSSPLLRELEMR